MDINTLTKSMWQKVANGTTLPNRVDNSIYSKVDVILDAVKNNIGSNVSLQPVTLRSGLIK